MSWFRRDDRKEHAYFEERLSAHLDGELLPRERAAVEQHLEGCSSCRWELDTLRQTVQWVSEMPALPVPRVFTLPASAAAARAPRRRWGLVPALQAATALVALLLFFAVAGDVTLTGLRPGSPAESQVLQATEVAEAVEEVVVEKEVEAPMMLEMAAPEEMTATGAITASQLAPSEPLGMGGGRGEQAVAEGAEATGPVAEAADRAPAPAGSPMPAVMATPNMSVTADLAAPPAALPTLEAPATRKVLPPPSAVVEVQEAAAPAAWEGEVGGQGALRERAATWLTWVEYVLGVILILLLGTTLAAMVWRRRTR